MVEGVSVLPEERLMEEKSTAEEHASSSNWVVEMEKMLMDADRSVEMERWSRPSIYRVPECIKNISNSEAEAYQPVLVSLGPFHHGKPNLLPMEEHKQRAVLHRVKRTGKPLAEFVTAVEVVVDELQSAYNELDFKWLGANRCRFVEMMVMDGCFVLEIIRTAAHVNHGFVPEDYAPNDPVFSKTVLFYLWPAIRTDMVMMENQLPLLVLQRLIAVSRGATPSAREINNHVLRFLNRSLKEGIDDLGLHPLDIFHKSFCRPYTDNQKSASLNATGTTPSVVELSKAGIHFKKSKTDSVGDVDFKSGVLSMPLVKVDDDSKKIYLNMMAFEQLHGDAGNHVMSYVFFMHNIIDSGDDVALLRSKDLIKNCLGSDKEVAELFNTLGKGTLLDPYSKLGEIHHQLNAHCKKRRNRWRANFVQTYLSTPWVFISLLAAAILLIATIIQTAYTVMSFYN